MANTSKTTLGLDLINISQEKLAESRVKISQNFQLIDDLFKSDVYDVRYYTQTEINATFTTRYTKDEVDGTLTKLNDDIHADINTEITALDEKVQDENTMFLIHNAISNLEVNGLQNLINKLVSSNQYDRVGEIVTTSGVIPFGDCLIADGRLLNRADYPKLFAFAVSSGNIVTDNKWNISFEFSYSYGDGVSTFRLPDYRGMFMRGLSLGKRNDENRIVGSIQTDSFKSHTHKELVKYRPIFASGANRWGVYNDGSTDMANPEDVMGAQHLVAGLVGGNETRPANGAVVYCIKYK